jgi:predicted MFS family arabinose efflux permease
MGVSVSVVTLLVILGSLICFSWRKRIQRKR